MAGADGKKPKSRPQSAQGMISMSINESAEVTEAKVLAMLQQYGCPAAFHQVRAQFLGAIASPARLTGITEIQKLWGGRLPTFASVDAANEFMAALVMGLWNQLTGHSDPGSPMRLTKVEHAANDQSLRRLAQTRKEEIEAFLCGFYADSTRVQVPDDIDRALDVLAEVGGMFEGIVNLPQEPDTEKSRAEIASIMLNLAQLTEIAEIEMHRIAVSAAAMRAGGAAARAPRTTRH